MIEQLEHSTSSNNFKAAKVQFFFKNHVPSSAFFLKDLNYLDFLRNMIF